LVSDPYFLTSRRLGFRRWSAHDLDLADRLWGDLEVTRWIDARGKLTRAQVRERLLREISTEKAHGIQYWPIFLLNTGEHIGCCGLRPHDAARGLLEIGFHIRPAHWGRGYAFEAARAAIGYAFDTRKASGLFAGHNPANAASRHLLGKLGFAYTHDAFYEPTGLYHPAYILTADGYAQTSEGNGA
jgi:RimJ/RimL family protein N-acetyltransferase